MKNNIYELSTNRTLRENTLVFEKKKQFTKEQEARVCQYRSFKLLKAPILQHVFFIYGDQLISLERDEESLFFDSLNLQNQVRPIEKIERETQSNFMRIVIRNDQQGLKDFRHVIHKLQTLQSQDMYNLSQVLMQYQQIVNADQIDSSNMSSDILANNQQVLIYFKNKVIPDILHYEHQQNPAAIQAYGLFECVNSLSDSRMSEYGFNENYMHLLGTDFQSIQQFYMREGWFFSMCGLNNELAKQHLQKVVDSFYLNQNCKPKVDEPYRFKFKTIDQIEIEVAFREKTYFIYKNCNQLYSDCLIPEMIQNLIGIFGIMTFDISPFYIQLLLNKRCSAQSDQNMLSYYSNQSLQKFQYDTESNYFINKFYENSTGSVIKYDQNGQSNFKYIQ